MRDATRPILLVEDDDIDVMTTQRAFEHHRVASSLRVVHNGAAALDYLRREGEYADADDGVPPAIILLDLKMPVMNGIEFLQVVKSDGRLKRIPVVVLTSSDEETDVVKSYELGVAGFIVKPVSFAKLLDAMKTFDMYWTLSEIP
jgi:CheY-like chemotaxis protein